MKLQPVHFGTRWYDFLIQVAVIFVSITLSFTFNNWQERRKNRELELFYLRQIQEDIAGDLKELDEDQKSYRFVENGYRYFWEYQPEKTKKPDSLYIYVNAFFREISPNVNNLGFETLRSSGKLDIISNPQIIRQLFKIHQEDLPNLQLGIEAYQFFRRETAYPLVFKKLNLTDRNTFRKLAADPEFRKLLTATFYFPQILNSYRAVEQDYMQLNRLIEEELKK
jgi:hypothetical protein